MEQAQHVISPWFWGMLVFVLGACWGSFLNVCIWRMPRDQSVIHPGSHCGICDSPIPWYHNIPLISYLVLGGRCHKCGARFSFRYWLVEFLNAALWLLLWREFQVSHGWLVVAAYCVLVSMLIIGTFIDFEFYIIPDRITLGSAVVGFLFSATVPSLHQVATRWQSISQSLLGIAAGAVTLYLIVEFGKLAFGRLKVPLPPGSNVVIAGGRIAFLDQEILWEDIFFRSSDRIRFRAATLDFQDQSFEDVEVSVSEERIEVGGQPFDLAKVGRIELTTDLLVIPREAMGLGDVKLMAGIGAFVGWQPIFFILLASALLGSIVGVALVILRLRELQGRIPYGPYIALATLIWILAGPEIMSWYWNLTAPAP